MFSISARIKIRKIVVLLLSICFSHTVHAQIALQNSLSQIFDYENLAGMSVTGVKQNMIAYKGSFGKRDIGRMLDVNDSTLFRIASVSKSVVAAGIMKLHEEGLLNVYNDVSRYLNFNLRNPYFSGDSITLRMLLNHTSSLQDGSGYDAFLSATAIQNPPPSLAELLIQNGSFYTFDMFRTSRPGAYFNYSNVEFGVLATAIEKVTGIRFDIWIRQNILLPLGIKGSFNIQDIDDINNVAVLYRYQSGQWVPQADNFMGIMPPPRDLSEYMIGTNGLIFSPAGGLRISALDLSVFMLMYMNDGIYNNTRILDDSTCRLFRRMQWNYMGPSTGNNYYGLFRKWGMGIQITTNAPNGDIVFQSGRPMWGHAGEAYGLISDMYADTLSESGVVFITNGKQGDYVTANGSAFYTAEKSVFDAVYDWTLEIPVSMKQADSITEPLGITPNPTSGYCTVHVAGTSGGQLRITDSEGKIIISQVAVPGDNHLDVSDLSSGVFYVQFTPESGIPVVKRLVKVI